MDDDKVGDRVQWRTRIHITDLTQQNKGLIVIVDHISIYPNIIYHPMIENSYLLFDGIKKDKSIGQLNRPNHFEKKKITH